MNTELFLRDPLRYFENSYHQFLKFGGPCVYFHESCLQACAEDFLSRRHIEMLYATLTAWGMHRMGEGMTKLVSWEHFSSTLLEQRSLLVSLQGQRMVDLTDDAYGQLIDSLAPTYFGIEVSISDSTIVANSKALFHVLPDLVPPIDRQYTWRFFYLPLSRWRCSNGKYRSVTLPAGRQDQFRGFRDTCLRVKRLADAAGRVALLAGGVGAKVSAPKAVDNAIMNFVRLHGMPVCAAENA